MKVVDRLKTSSKWQTGAIALVWVLFNPLLTKWGVNEEVFTKTWMTLLAVIAGQTVVDFGKEAKK